MGRSMARVLLAIMLLAASLSAPVAVTPAAAQQGAPACFSDTQTRGAVQQGQAQPLSNLIAGVQARFGGQVVSSRLCQNGGRLTYIVTLLIGGQVREVRVDAISGAVQ
jgi:uncharacterized membrane protein YkoI